MEFAGDKKPPRKHRGPEPNSERLKHGDMCSMFSAETCHKSGAQIDSQSEASFGLAPQTPID